jgi:predicted TPR repeat methyltransferase
VAALAGVTGLDVLAREDAVLRLEKGAPVAGALFVLRARG